MQFKKPLGRKRPHGPAFRKLQVLYDLSSPQQIKLSIIWCHVKALVKAQYPGPAAEKLLRKYDRHWRQCELEEGG